MDLRPFEKVTKRKVLLEGRGPQEGQSFDVLLSGVDFFTGKGIERPFDGGFLS